MAGAGRNCVYIPKISFFVFCCCFFVFFESGIKSALGLNGDRYGSIQIIQ